MITLHPQDQTLEQEREKANSPATEVHGEVEFVMGPRQMAGIGFVVMVALAIFSSVSYLAGKSSAPKPAPAAQPAPAPAPAAAPTPPPPSAPRAEPVAEVPPAPIIANLPIFANPETGKLYLQIAAVERPAASVFVEGLRTHKLKAFFAPGADDKIVRVLVGPLESTAEFNQNKEAVEKIGFEPMPRRY
jgi:cell division septation protein DedD